jgi:hypothetical protein
MTDSVFISMYAYVSFFLLVYGNLVQISAGINDHEANDGRELVSSTGILLIPVSGLNSWTSINIIVQLQSTLVGNIILRIDQIESKQIYDSSVTTTTETDSGITSRFTYVATGSSQYLTFKLTQTSGTLLDRYVTITSVTNEYTSAILSDFPIDPYSMSTSVLIGPTDAAGCGPYYYSCSFTIYVYIALPATYTMQATSSDATRTLLQYGSSRYEDLLINDQRYYSFTVVSGIQSITIDTTMISNSGTTSGTYYILCRTCHSESSDDVSTTHYDYSHTYNMWFTDTFSIPGDSARFSLNMEWGNGEWRILLVSNTANSIQLQLNAVQTSDNSRNDANDRIPLSTFGIITVLGICTCIFTLTQRWY